MECAPCTFVTADDVACWPLSVSLLVKFTSFWRTLYSPVRGDDSGVGSVLYPELLILGKDLGWRVRSA